MTSSAARGTFSSPSLSGVAAAERRSAGHRTGAAFARWALAKPAFVEFSLPALERAVRRFMFA
jgi:hypothetical protein